MPNGVMPAALSFFASARKSAQVFGPLFGIEARLLEQRLVPDERDAEQVLRHRPELAARHVLGRADPVLRLARRHVVGDRHGGAVPGGRQRRQRRPLRRDVRPALRLRCRRERRGQRVGGLDDDRDLHLRVRLLVDGDFLLEPVVGAGRVALRPVPVGEVRVVRVVGRRPRGLRGRTRRERRRCPPRVLRRALPPRCFFAINASAPRARACCRRPTLLRNIMCQSGLQSAVEPPAGPARRRRSASGR